MKKIFFLVIALLIVNVICAQYKPEAVLIKGDAKFIDEPVNVYVNLDFSNAVQVSYKSDNMRVDDVVGRFVDRNPEEWNEDLRKLHKLGIKLSNKYVKRGNHSITFVDSPENAKYELYLRVDTLDCGNVGAAFGLAWKGGAILTGELIVREIATKNEVCVVRYNHLKHPGGQGVEWIRIHNITYGNAIDQFLLGLNPFNVKVSNGPKAPNYPFLYPEKFQ